MNSANCKRRPGWILEEVALVVEDFRAMRARLQDVSLRSSDSTCVPLELARRSPWLSCSGCSRNT